MRASRVGTESAICWWELLVKKEVSLASEGLLKHLPAEKSLYLSAGHTGHPTPATVQTSSESSEPRFKSCTRQTGLVDRTARPPRSRPSATGDRAMSVKWSSEDVVTWKPGPVGAVCNTPTNPDKAVVSDKTDRLPAIFRSNSPSHNGTLRESLSGCRFLRTLRQCHTTYKGRPPDGNTAQSTVSTPSNECRSGVKRTKTKSRFQTRRRGGDLRLPIFRQTRDMSSPQQRSVTCTSWTFASCSSAASRRSTLQSI